MMSPLASYLSYYSTLQKPCYAVLVTGPWGTGKTYQVNRALADHYYVSLYGLKSTDEIISAVYAEMFPNRDKIKKAASGASEFGGEAFGFSVSLGGVFSGLANAMLRNKVATDKVLVFDDLERCRVDIDETLGTINMYVEHHGCRVVVIAHEEELQSADKFNNSKEKIFGQTIRVEPQIEAAFRAFLEPASDPAKGFISRHETEILRTFVYSEVLSLRILRHIIEDLARLYGTLDSKHTLHPEAMTALVQFFCAYNIEWRADRLDQIDISSPLAAHLAHQTRRMEGQKQAENLSETKKRYPFVDLSSTLIPGPILAQILIDGHFDRGAIGAALDASTYFMVPEQDASWKILRRFEEFPDSIVQPALAQFEEDFRSRKSSESGAILHIFALRFKLSKIGLIAADFDEIALECKKYIEDLTETRRLPARDAGEEWYEPFRGSWDGWNYLVHEDYETHFQDLFNQLIQTRELIFLREFAAKSGEFLSIVEADGSEFYALLCDVSSHAETPIATSPVLPRLQPAQFVAAWMRSSPMNWQAIAFALNVRCKRAVDKRWGLEVKWLKDVISLLEERAASASGFEKARIERVLALLPHRKGPQEGLDG
ncbi:hypothetical protein BLJAPNOD_06181 [Ensifer sp. M14]|uniref:P-loop NTPase fold protein n=1 Tax=Ensifer sp. M14 TaxID=2203782 RepID=UPI000E1C778D|nr:P-loop NTPase fold protein [Ensifer sp. M14]RDL47341.1 hypothetical protein BLJAPNOD_06181 [Ensifer sp. M14]